MSIRVRWLRVAAVASLTFTLVACGGPATSQTVGSTAESTTATADADVRGERATVDRVIDGDTVDVILRGETVRVRLLNVDAPETKHPNELVECLGPEASEHLEELLPPGTVVGLEYDKVKKDRYGRTLAGVFLEDGRLVNAEIAREGLGVPVSYAPNVKFLPPVEEAYAEALAQKRGLLDPDAECTIPAQVAAAAEGLEQADPSTAADPAAETVQELLDDIDAVDVNAYPFVGKVAESSSVGMKIQSLRNKMEDLRSKKDDQAEPENKSSSNASHEESGQTQPETGNDSSPVTAPAETDRDVVAPAPHPEPDTAPEVVDQVQSESAPELTEDPPPVLPEAPVPAAPVEPVRPAPDPQPEHNVAEEAPPGYVSEIPGYTGPRCYAPGGKFYKPC